MQTIDRREFIKLSGFMGALATLSACDLTSPENLLVRLTPSTGSQIDDEDWLIFQALRRITFGPRPEEIAHAKEIGLDNFIDEQLASESIDDSSMDDHLQGFETFDMTPSVLFDLEPRGLPIFELIRATMLRAVYSKRQLFELMVDFWSNHFNVYVRKNQVGLLKIADDQEVIRPHALGNFHDMLSASAHSPAMLVYLDNAQSNQEHPNENYARELLELHTLGVDGGYSHDDILEVARALTGWSVSGPRDDEPGYFRFRQRAHDNGEKQILGHEFPAGGGIDEGQQLLAILAEHPSTAAFVSSKLVRRFVADDPPASLVTKAAQTFSQTRGDIRRVMSTILHSDEFKSSLGTKLKRPFEYLVSALRMTNADAQVDRPTGRFLTQMGQPLFHWSPPDGYPDYASAWSTTNGMLSRWNIALALAFNIARDTQIEWPELVGAATSSQEALNNISSRLLGTTLNEDANQVVLEFTDQLTPEMTNPAIGALLMASPFFQYR